MNKNSQSLIIGAAWNREKENEKGKYSFKRMALTGKRTEDPFEVILRTKANQVESALSDLNIIMVDNGSKKTDKHPDFIVKAFIPEGTAFIGVAWNKTKENEKGQYTFQSVAFSGNREKDEYEVILRNKEDKSELALFETPVIMVENTGKKSDKSPDFLIKAFYDAPQG